LSRERSAKIVLGDAVRQGAKAVHLGAVRLTLLHNPTAGHGRHTADELQDTARALGHTIAAHSVERESWIDALADPGDLVVVAGGDGTVARIAARMIGSRVPLAVIPMGTANNIATTLGVVGSPREMMEAWGTAQPVGVDVGHVHSEGRSLPFFECVGVGEFGRLMAHSQAMERSDREGDRERKLARDLVLLREKVATSSGQPVTLEIDGVERSGEYLLAEVLNVWTIGPRLGLAPSARIDDGRLHVVLVGLDHRAELVRYLERLQHGFAEPPELEVITASQVRLGCQVHDLHIDGELWEAPSPIVAPRQRVELDVSLLRGAVQFLRPL
jgi:diacylglycerol kinase (ATP)